MYDFTDEQIEEERQRLAVERETRSLSTDELERRWKDPAYSQEYRDEARRLQLERALVRVILKTFSNAEGASK